MFDRVGRVRTVDTGTRLPHLALSVLLNEPESQSTIAETKKPQEDLKKDLITKGRDKGVSYRCVRHVIVPYFSQLQVRDPHCTGRHHVIVPFHCINSRQY